jgi:hypothetical protein
MFSLSFRDTYLQKLVQNIHIDLWFDFFILSMR